MSDPRLRIVSATTEGIVFEMCETSDNDKTVAAEPRKGPVGRVSITIEGNHGDEGPGLYLTRTVDLRSLVEAEAVTHNLAFKVGRMVRELQ